MFRNPYPTPQVILYLHYEAEPVNSAQGDDHCLLRESKATHKYTLWVKFGDFNVETVG
jgi:hypothetical protein